MQQYKVLIFDLDGTAMISKLEASVSLKVIEAVHKAHQKLIVTCATGRTFAHALQIVKDLGITSPSIFFGGSQIVDTINGSVLWKIIISKEKVKQILEISKKYPSQVFLTNDSTQYSNTDEIVAKEESIVYLKEINNLLVPKLIEEVNAINDVVAHSTSSWNPDCLDVHITHKQATKKHALEKLLDILNVQKKDVIAVGDNGNDLPLFENAGLKIAMSNGTNELKERADFITKDVTEDGLAFAIEKYVLTNS